MGIPGRIGGAAALLAAMATPLAAQGIGSSTGPVSELPPIVVVAPAPLPGSATGVPPKRLP